jgi:hypothetical protein
MAKPKHEKKHRVERPYMFHGWDEDPIDKYSQPKPNDVPTGSGYPQEGIDNDNVLVKGRWPKGTRKKELMEIKGAGAAERGKKFHVYNQKKYSVEE